MDIDQHDDCARLANRTRVSRKPRVPFSAPPEENELDPTRPSECTRSPDPAGPSQDESGSNPDDDSECLLGTEVQLVADDSRSRGYVVQEKGDRVRVEGALIDGKYFAGWVQKDELVGHSS